MQGFDFHNNSENTQQIIGIKFLNNIFLKNHILKDKIESFENIFLGDSKLFKKELFPGHNVIRKAILNTIGIL